MVRTCLSIILMCLSCPNINAQKIDHLASFRDIKSDTFFRFTYDNDYFAATDRNYTQGYSFEFVGSYFKKNPINAILIKPNYAHTRYGLATEHIGFTPRSYELPEIQIGDRPFSAVLSLKSYAIVTDTLNAHRVTSSFYLGIIGSGALGGEMQVAIHRATGNKIPQGWNNQIKNDVVINYELGYEKQLIRVHDFFALRANATLKLGTLFTNATVGANATLGIINDPFTSTIKRNGFKLFVYAQPVYGVVGYDATLQGGVFNRSSPYVIANREVERFTSQFNYGIVLKTRTLYFEYARSVISKEFETGNTAKWGGIRIGFTY